MIKLLAAHTKFVRDEEGASLVEYGLLLSLVAVVCIVAISKLGSEEFKEREAASAELLKFGPKAYPALLAAAKSGDNETQRRAEDGELLGRDRVVDAVSALGDVEDPWDVHCGRSPYGCVNRSVRANAPRVTCAGCSLRLLQKPLTASG